jgi:hypothetical protein
LNERHYLNLDRLMSKVPGICPSRLAEANPRCANFQSPIQFRLIATVFTILPKFLVTVAVRQISLVAFTIIVIQDRQLPITISQVILCDLASGLVKYTHGLARIRAFVNRTPHEFSRFLDCVQRINLG